MKLYGTRKIVSCWSIVLAGMTVILLSGCGTRPVTPSAGPAPTGPRWVSDASLSSRLGPEEPVAGYGIRPPAGYTEQTILLTAKDGFGIRHVWTGPMGANGIAPFLQMDVGTDNGKTSSRATSDDLVQIGFAAASQNHEEMTLSTVGQGSINGLAFSRGYWKGTGQRTGKVFHGLVYARVSTPIIVTITGRDAEPTYRQSLPLLEASALTVRKL